jgi:hypothetical protein
VPDADGVGMDSEHDRDGSGRLPGGLDRGRRRREDDVDFHADQFGCHLGQLLGPFRPAELDGNVFALDIAEVSQARAQRLDPGHVGRSGGGPDEADLRDFRLRASRGHAIAPPRRVMNSRRLMVDPARDAPGPSVGDFMLQVQAAECPLPVIGVDSGGGNPSSTANASCEPGRGKTPFLR